MQSRKQTVHTGENPPATSPDAAPVSAAEVRAALESVVHSETFARAERARALLSYIVETEQRGEASRLKGFTIAQDVFGKDDDFDPAMDAVVRVQAGRLREHLASFYSAEGRDDPVEITVPKGSYVPVYVRRAPSVPEGETDRADGPLRNVDFGASGGAFKLDAVKDGEAFPAAQKLAQPTAGSDPWMNPFIVRNIRRFWLALAMIIVLLSVILYLVWWL